MFSFNQFTVIGTLCKEPYIKPMSNGKDFVRLTIVTSRSRKVGEQWQQIPDYHDIVLFGSNAEQAKKIVKGEKVGAVGTIQTNNWTGPDGQKHYGKSFVAESIIILTTKKQYIQNKMEQDIASDVSAFDDGDVEPSRPSVGLPAVTGGPVQAKRPPPAVVGVQTTKPAMATPDSDINDIFSNDLGI